MTYVCRIEIIVVLRPVNRECLHMVLVITQTRERHFQADRQTGEFDAKT